MQIWPLLKISNIFCTYWDPIEPSNPLYYPSFPPHLVKIDTWPYAACHFSVSSSKPCKPFISITLSCLNLYWPCFSTTKQPNNMSAILPLSPHSFNAHTLTAMNSELVLLPKVRPCDALLLKLPFHPSACLLSYTTFDVMPSSTSLLSLNHASLLSFVVLDHCWKYDTPLPSLSLHVLPIMSCSSRMADHLSSDLVSPWPFCASRTLWSHESDHWW